MDKYFEKGRAFARRYVTEKEIDGILTTLDVRYMPYFDKMKLKVSPWRNPVVKQYVDALEKGAKVSDALSKMARSDEGKAAAELYRVAFP